MIMWILYAFGSALFAGITSILAKTGIKNTNSHLATALRTVVVLLFAWLMAFIVSGDRLGEQLLSISGGSLLFLVLSGLTTGASWLCYFRALQLGEAYKVAAVDKSSTILTMILAFFFLSEPLSANMLVGMAAMAVGTILMIEHPKTSSDVRESGSEGKKPGRWILYALFSAVFASLTSILVKVGIREVESNLGTAIRTVVVLIFAWLIVIAQGRQREIKTIDKKSWLFLVLSGFATGLSWILYYRALQEGPASVVVPIDKLSILATVLFARAFLKEKLSPRALAGLTLVTAGTLVLLVKF